MKTYKEFVFEYYHVPALSIEKTQVDINKPETLNELNKYLAMVSAVGYNNVYSGLNAVKKVLSKYEIELPQIQFENELKGKMTVPVAQFISSGESHVEVTEPFGEDNYDHLFVFEYELVKGVYQITAEVVKK